MTAPDTLELVLAHGASGNATSMAPWVEALGRRGVRARAIDLPVRKAEAAVPVFRAQVASPAATVPGGHSYGGRVASLLAAELISEGHSVLGLVVLSYPLHRPGHPEGWDERTAHWPRISCPVLLLSGEADPFARLDLLRGAVGRLPDARLRTYPRVGHGLGRVLDAAADEVAAFVRELVAPAGR